MKLNYVKRISAYVSTFYHSEYITRSSNLLTCRSEIELTPLSPFGRSTVSSLL